MIYTLVFFLRGDGKLSKPQMINLEVSQVVRIA
jgi:hypothetical protein